MLQICVNTSVCEQDRAVVKKLAEDVGLDVIQLSGHEGWDDLAFYAPFPVIAYKNRFSKKNVTGMIRLCSALC